MFRILLLSAFCLLLAAIGKFLFVDEYHPLDSRQIAVSASVASSSTLASRYADSPGLVAAAPLKDAADSLLEEPVPAAAGPAGNLDAGSRSAIARDLLAGGVREPVEPAAGPAPEPPVPEPSKAAVIAAVEPTAPDGVPPASDPGAAGSQPSVPALPAALPPVLSPALLPAPLFVGPETKPAPGVAAPNGVNGQLRQVSEPRRGAEKAQVAGSSGAGASAAQPRKRPAGTPREAVAASSRGGAQSSSPRPPAEKQAAKAEPQKAAASRSPLPQRRESEPSAKREAETLARPAPSADVSQAQQMLARLGYNPGPSDGVAGGRTVDAVRLYQARVGAPADGRIDRKLLARLEQDVRVPAARATPRRAGDGNTGAAGGMARSTSSLNGDESVSRWVGDVATGVQRLLGHEFNSVTQPRSVVSYCRSQPDSWVYDEGRKQMVYCGEVAARNSASR